MLYRSASRTLRMPCNRLSSINAIASSSSSPTSRNVNSVQIRSFISYASYTNNQNLACRNVTISVVNSNRSFATITNRNTRIVSSTSSSWQQLQDFYYATNLLGSPSQRRGYQTSSSSQDADRSNSMSSSNSSSNNNVPVSMTSSTSQRPQMRIGDLLKGLEHRNFAVSNDCSVEDAIAHLVKEKLGSALVTNDAGAVLGIFTARDLLKFINEKSPHNPNHSMHMKNAAQGTHVNLHELLHNTKITEAMTKKEKLIYCSPNDSVKHIREIMFQLKIRNLPVLDNNRIRGIVTMKVLADAYFNAADVGGKKSYMSNVTGRKGIPDTAKVSTQNSSSSNNGSSSSNGSDYVNIPGGGSSANSFKSSNSNNSGTNSSMLDLEVGAYALPHPYKHPKGVSIDRRSYGAFELATDLSLSEDAHFAIRVKDPLFVSCALYPSDETDDTNSDADTATNAAASSSSSSSSTNSNNNNNNNNKGPSVGEDVYLPVAVPKRESQVYLCVADGVGSWRQFGVDPRNYPVTLVDNARRVIEADFSQRALMGSSPFDRDLDPIHPLDVMLDAWNVTTSEGVMGSCTFCIATLDKKLNQLHYSNVGDGGLIVLRRMDDAAEGTAGYLLSDFTEKKRHRRTQTPWKVAYLSQQQMKSFNLPYQLGNNPRAKNIVKPSPPASQTSKTILSPEEEKKLREEEEFWMYAPRVFETPADADTASIPIMPGDLIVLSTDGMFDNMDLDDVIQVVSQWENTHFPGAMGLLDGSYYGHGAMESLARELVEAARQYSLDKQRDGPFALLAKENDILWSGGMPDDTTVVVARVVRDTQK